ncbi:hypothetical protein [Cryptosporangium sp. NPDC048952]|uniref:hypothetical protein n=1 Tax=Cryptosporangium sp. NPDC048952 TaxID=3363961 RepID=UPI00371CE831
MSGSTARQRAERRSRAHEIYRRSLETGAPLSAGALAETLGMSERWARAQIAAVRAAAPPLDASALRPIIAVRPAAKAEAARPEESSGAEPGAVAGPVREASREIGGPVVPDPAIPNVARHGRSPGYWAALAAFLGGVVLSVSANVAHTFHPSEALRQAGVPAAFGVPGTFVPDPGAVVAAACWPLLLLGAVEVVVRVPWPPGVWWGLARYGGAVLVALIAAYMSYRHMSGLLRVYGEDRLGAGLGPLAVDGLMVVSGFALLAIGLRSRSGAASVR